MGWLIKSNNGMMFGNRINIIDFLVFLFILCLLPIFFFSWKIITKPKVIEKPPTIQLDKAEYERVQNQIKDFLKEHKRARKYFEGWLE